MNKLRYIAILSAFLMVPYAAGQTVLERPKQITPSKTVQAPPVQLPKAVIEKVEAANAETCKALEPKRTTFWHPGFDWSTPKRYGNDRKVYRDSEGNPVGNGIVDLPNTLDYVMNRVSYSNEATDACPCKPTESGNCEARFRINFNLNGTGYAKWRRVQSTLKAHRERESCPVLDVPERPIATFLFEIDGEEIPVSDDQRVSACLTEGHHPVTLHMSYGEESRAVTRQIEVIDHLIVNLGDSYGAGEGTPETNFRPKQMRPYDFWGNLGEAEDVDWSKNHIAEIPFFAQWADPGIPIPMTTRPVQAFSRLHKAGWDDGVNARSHTVLIAKQEDKTYRGSITLPNWQKIKDDFYGLSSTISDKRREEYRILMDHHHAHRSSATGSSQLALHLEHHDPKSSVTYINLAASGGTIEKGVVGPYNGVFELKSATTGRAYLPKHDGKFGLRPQLDEMELLMGRRSADHIYLSVGGNDAGFANIIAVFFGAWNFGGTGLDGNVKTMLDLFKSGKWKNADYGASLLSIAGFKHEDIAGLHGLVTEYRRVHSRLISMYKRRSFRGDITLIGYPDFATSTRRDQDPRLQQAGTDNPKRYYCDLHVGTGDDNSLSLNADFDPHEFRTAQTKVSAALESKMADAVAAMNKGQNLFKWTFLRQGSLPGLHGICGYGQYDRFRFAERYGQYRKDNHFSGKSLTNSVADGNGFAWYRSPAAGAATQRGMAVTNLGLFHPNEFGYRHVGRRMLEQLEFYGAEFANNTYIASRPGFIDRDDSIKETRDGGTIRLGETFGEAIAGSHDVEMVRLPAFNRRCQAFTVELNGSAGVDDLVVTVFGENGEVITSSSPDLTPTPPKAKPSNPLLPGNDIAVINQPTMIERAVKIPGLTNLTNPDGFCRDEDYEALAAARDAHGALDRVSFMTEHFGFAYIAISHADNLAFDPVTGRGDNRDEMRRRPVKFSARVYAAE